MFKCDYIILYLLCREMIFYNNIFRSLMTSRIIRYAYTTIIIFINYYMFWDLNPQGTNWVSVTQANFENGAICRGPMAAPPTKGGKMFGVPYV